MLAARANAANQAAARDLLIRHARAVREKGLSSGQPILTMQSAADGTFVQMIETSESRNSAAILDDPALAEIRKELQSVAAMTPMSQVAESPCAFASFALLSED